MKKSSKYLTYAMTGALSLGILGAATIPAFAATSQDGTRDLAKYSELDDATKSKVDEILTNLQQELAELGVSFKGIKGDKFADLDDETKAKAEAIMDQVKDGTLTRDEANTQLEALGVSLPDHKGKGDLFADLDDETKAKAEAIMDQVKEGSLTRDEANTQLEALGVSLPDHNGKGDKFENLDDETKDQVEVLFEETEEQLDELGVELPKKFEHVTK